MSTDDDLIKEAKENFQAASDNDGDRARSLEAWRFTDEARHWEDAELRQRSLDSRPALTTNLLPAYIRQVVNDARQNQVQIKVHPVGGEASDEIANVYEGLIRHIEYDSMADSAYDTALEHAVKGGFGYFRAITEYVSPMSFDQKIMIKRVRNPFSVLTDPNAIEPDGSDMGYGFVSSRLSKNQFKLQYPKATTTFDQIGRATGDNGGWVDKDTCRISEYYRVEEDRKTLVLMSDGTTRLATDKEPLPEGVEPVATRETLVRKVMWYKLTGAEVLEKVEIPCPWIPIFPVYGNESDIDGKLKRTGLVADAMDPSRMYNYWLSSATEEIALRTKTPFIGAAGQFEGFEKDWVDANRRNFAYLEYNPVTLEGSLAPAPQRQSAADVPAGYIAMSQIARENIKAVTGIFDASLGARSNETSGKAIMARQREGDVSTFHYPDNLSRAITHLGRCLVYMIPKIYDTERMERIVDPDGTARQVTLNERLPQPKQDKSGAIQTIANDLTIGEYAVAIDTGPAYTTLRQEAADAMLSVGQSWPKLFEVAGDKVVRAMGWPNGDDIADRIEKTLPPNLLEQDNDDEPGVNVQGGKVSAEQASQMIAQMDDTLQQMQQEMDHLESGMAKAELDAQTKLQIAEMQTKNREDVEEIKGMIAMLLQTREINARDNEPDKSPPEAKED
jgi:hypothetical protein